MRTSIAAVAARRSARIGGKADRKYRLGLTLMQQGRWTEAAAAFESALDCAPKHPLLWVNLAQAHRKLGRAEDAERAARKALQLDPQFDLARRFVADALSQQGRHREAADLLDAAGGCDAYAVRIEAGDAALQGFDAQRALDAYMDAARQRPERVAAHLGIGHALAMLKLPQAAYESFRTALALDPDHVGALSGAIHQALHACLWDTLAADLARLRELAARGDRGQPVPFAHLSMPGTDAAEHLRSAAHFWRQCAAGVQPFAPRASESRRPGRIRVGYLSSDFHEHATSWLLRGAVESHDRDRFEVFLYSYGIDDGSALRRAMQTAGEHFVELRHASAHAIAQRIRADDIDILVDLKGYTLDARPQVLAWRPAPVQASFLGYPGTLGSDAVDYLITDPVVTPAAAADHYTERFAYLPDCYQPNDRQRPIGPAATRADCGLPDHGFVFCCFNNTYKITPQAFDVWCRLLAQVPGSVLWLLLPNPQALANLRREAQARGIDAQRLVFAPPLPLDAHLARLALADLVLDTWPYNVHTTGSDALWAGVPIVTWAGPTFAARVGASLLRAARLPELIADSPQAYEALALRLAQRPQELAALRARLAAQREVCPLFDSKRYARNLEALYERMFERWRNGLPAAHLEPLQDGRTHAAIHDDARREGAPAGPSTAGEHGAAAGPAPTHTTPWAAQRLEYACPAERADRPLQVAVVTPYYREDRCLLERCIDSVRAQTYRATHFVVADGHPQAWLDDAGVRHLRLDCAQANAGNTPRAIGGLLAISEGFDAICFLDADNWFDREHVQLCVEAALRGDRPDFVIARRRLVRIDGSPLPLDDAEETTGHVDTSCYFLLRGAFHTVARWAAIPRPLACIGDRVFGAGLRAENLRSARVERVTVNYLCTYASLFRAAGETPPPYAKPNVDVTAMLQWWQGLADADRRITERLIGAQPMLF